MQSQKKIYFVTQDDKLSGRVEEIVAKTDLVYHPLTFFQEIEAVVRLKVPHIVLLDADLSPADTINTCALLRSIAGATEMAILVLVSQMDDEGMVALLDAGADDIVGRRIKPLSFRARITSHLRRVTGARELARNVHDSEVLIEITSTLISQVEIIDGLYQVAVLISHELDVDRCSVVLIRPERDYGLVIASNDDPTLRSLPIKLGRYPEIAKAAEQQTPLIIDNIEDSNLLRHVLPDLQTAGVKSVALFPIIRKDKTVGVIFLRFLEARKGFTKREFVFCQTVANAASIALRNVEIVEMLKAKTLEVEKVQLEAQSRLSHLQRFEAFFNSAADGIVVIEPGNQVLFANPQASALLETKKAALRGRTLTDFFKGRDRQRFEQLMDEFNRGNLRKNHDFAIVNSDDTKRIVSISAASLVDEQEMMLLVMRDVTEERTMAHQLLEAQQKLVQSEKQAAMVELAGTAAHELNNPLTSVFTSLAMARRQMSMNGQIEDRILDSIETETERMASIIRRFGKITQYSTTSYIGDARIIDLEKASPLDPEEDA